MNCIVPGAPGNRVTVDSEQRRGLVQPRFIPRRFFGNLSELDCFQALGIKGYTLGFESA
jgi:hypothetical protein